MHFRSMLCLLLVPGLTSFGCAAGSKSKVTKPAAAPVSAVLGEREATGNRHVEPRALPPAGLGVIKNATIMTATGKAIRNGHIVTNRGIIVSLASGAPGKLPGKAAWVVDAKGMVVTPGLIDTHSHLGVYPSPRTRAHSDGNEATSPTTGGVWAEHSFWPNDPGIETALAGGVTTIQVLPGSANLIGGRAVTLHLTAQRGARAMRFPQAPVGVKMACGENPKRVYGHHRKRAPATRMGNVHGHRTAFIKAREYLNKLKTKGHQTPRNLELETLAGVLEGTFLPQVHCYRADDLVAFMQMADEFGFKIRSFHHGLEAYKVRDLLKKRNVAVSTWADWWGYKMEMFDGIPHNIALLHKSGVKAVVHSDSAQDIQRLNQEAGKAQRYGKEAGIAISDNDALRWITANPAWVLGIQDRVGTLEVGKIADIVVWSGHPFSVYTSANVVILDGHITYRKGTRRRPRSDFEVGQDVEGMPQGGAR